MRNKIITIGGLKEYFSNNSNKLSIPFLQREYVWTKKEWERLFRDILDIDQNNYNQLFLGVITVLEKEEGQYEVIDGQQRLTTLTILMDMLNDRVNGIHNENSYFNIDKLKAVRNTVNLSIDLDSSKEETQNNDVYCCVYNYFVRELSDKSEEECKSLFSRIKAQVYVYLEFVDEDSETGNDAFERLNAKGEQLVYTDLILNHILSMAKTENLDIQAIKTAWQDILKSVSDEELPPQIDNDDDLYDEKDENIENDDDETEAEDITESIDDTESDNEKQEKLKPLKIKKFFNALYNIALMRRRSFPESVDDFVRMYERLFASFYTIGSMNAGCIINVLGIWSKYYLEYVSPFTKDKKDKKYSDTLYLLKTIGNTALIPAVMRTLYRVNNKALTEDDANNIFKALVSAQLLRAAYTERDNSTDMDNKLRIADYIYLAIEKNKRSYQTLLAYLVDIEDFKKSLENDRNNIIAEKYDDVQLWKMPYNSGYSKAILLLRYADKIKEISNEEIQVEHMVALKINEQYSNYGYDESNINSFWNLELLESSLNKEAGNNTPSKKLETWKNSYFNDNYPKTIDNNNIFKESRTEKLKELFESFSEYIGIGVMNGNSKEDLEVVSYHMNGLYETMISKYEKPVENKVYSVTISKDGKYNIEPAIKKNTNDTEAYIFITKDDTTGNITTKSITAKSEAIKKALELFGAEIYNVIKDFEKEEAKAANLLFISDEWIKNNPNNSTAKRINKKDNEVELNGNSFYMNINTGKDAFSKAFKALYFSSSDKADKAEFNKFGLVLKMKNKNMCFVNNRRILTNYISIGDPDLGNAYITQQMRQEKPNSPVKQITQNSSPKIDLYIRTDSWEFKVFIDKMYTIPEYQRAYVWGEEQFQALVDSLGENFPLGTIILRETERENEYSIVDGQQRLTTIGSLYNSIVSEKYAFCLENANAKDYFEEFIYNNNDEAELKGKVKIIQALLTRARFNVLIISKDAPETFQYKVFGTINGCGKNLTTDDKVKNYLLARGGKPEDVKNILKCPGFIKAYTEMRKHNHISEQFLYPTFKEICEKEDKEVILGELKKYSETYKYIKIKNNNKDELTLWLEMYRLLEVNTADALLLHVFKNYDKEYQTAFMRKLIMMYFRFILMTPTATVRKASTASSLR